LNIVVPTNDNVHCNMSCEDNHKKDGHLWALIAKIENLIIITIKK